MEKEKPNQQLISGCSIISEVSCNARWLDASSCRENRLLSRPAERHRTWPPCGVFSVFQHPRSCIALSHCTVTVFLEQPLLLFAGQFFSYTKTLNPGTPPATLPPFVFRTCFFFVCVCVFFFSPWLAGPPAWRSVVCVCLTLAGGTQAHHLCIQLLSCSSGWEGAGLRSGMLCRWWQRQSSVYLIKFSAFSDVR